MSEQVEGAIRSHFLEWSGGTPPDSPFEIFAYIELARLSEFDYEETRLFLKKWMEEQWVRIEQ